MKTLHYKQWSSRILPLLISICAVTACADVYQWHDAEGKRHYSDKARPNSRKLAIQPGHAYVYVDKVFDGDTIRLTDGRRVRLLGVNTPEVQHRNQSGQAGGEAAKTWLTQTLLHRKVRLVPDVEAEDKYHRTLAHVFTEQNEHINLQLAESGLAAVDIHPPNLLYADQLTAAQARAEQARRGIWGREDYAPIPVGDLTEDGHGGWSRLTEKSWRYATAASMFIWNCHRYSRPR